MVHNASQKWLCSGNERIHFQIKLKHSDQQTFHVFYPVPVYVHVHWHLQCEIICAPAQIMNNRATDIA